MECPLSFWNFFAVPKGLKSRAIFCFLSHLIHVLKMSWFSFYQWIILFIILTKNEIRCGRLHCSVNLFRHSFQHHKKITVVKDIFPNYPPSSSRPLTLTLPPEQHPIRPSSRRFIFDPLHFFNIVDRVPKISVRAFCPLLARSVKTCTTTIGWNGLVPFRKQKNIQRNWKHDYVCHFFTTLPRIEGPLNWWNCLYGCPKSRQ